MKWSMKYKAGLLLTIFIMEISGILMTPISNTGIWWKQLYHLEEGELDIIFLGNSHCYCTFNPGIVNEITGKKSMQIGSGSLDMVGVYYYLKEVFRYQSPELVVIEAYSFIDRDMWWNQESMELSRINAIEAMGWGPVRIEASMEMLGTKKAIGKMFPFIDYHGNWENPEYMEKRLRYLISPKALDKYDSYFENESMMTEATALKYKEMDMIDIKWEADSDQIAAWEKITQFCNDKNVQLVVVMAPIYKEWRNHVDYEIRHNQIKDLAEGSQSVFIDYNDSQLYDELSFDESCYLNDEAYTNGNTHLNNKGSGIVSKHFAEWLKSSVLE